MSKRIPTTEQLTAGTLIDRTEKIVKLYDAEPKGHGFHDSGDANSYAAEMADLLEQWAKAGRASRALHPSNQGAYEIYAPDEKTIEAQRLWHRERGDWP